MINAQGRAFVRKAVSAEMIFVEGKVRERSARGRRALTERRVERAPRAGSLGPARARRGYRFDGSFAFFEFIMIVLCSVLFHCLIMLLEF